MVLNGDKIVLYNLNFLKFKQTAQKSDQKPRSMASDLVCMFANVSVQVLQITLFTLHSDVTATRIARL